MLAGTRATIPDRLAHAVIGPAGHGGTAYDALHDPELTRRLLQAVAGRETIGPLSFGAEPDAVIATGADSLVLTGEQSNTSLLFGEEAILKVFRRPSPGPNPDLEIPRALARLGSLHVAPPLGWLQTTMDGQPTVLAILSTYLKSAADGWSLTATSVRDLYADGDYTDSDVRAADAGGDFAPEAHRLGEATAEVHRALADAFGVHELPGGAHRALAAQMTRPAGGRARRRAGTGPVRAAADRGLRRARGARRAAGGAADPRRLPPRAGGPHPVRLGAAGLRGRARHPAGPAPGPVPGAAGRRLHAALVRLRRPATSCPAIRCPSGCWPRPATG